MVAVRLSAYIRTLGSVRLSLDESSSCQQFSLPARRGRGDGQSPARGSSMSSIDRVSIGLLFISVAIPPPFDDITAMALPCRYMVDNFVPLQTYF